MLPIPPLASSVIGAAAAQRQSEERLHLQQRAADRAKETAPTGDRYEHSVESSDAIQPIRDQDDRAQQQKKKQKRKPYIGDEPDDGESHLDLKA